MLFKLQHLNPALGRIPHVMIIKFVLCTFSKSFVIMETKQTKECYHGLEDCYHVFWDECRSIHSEHDLHDHHEVEPKSRDYEGGMCLLIDQDGFEL